ncbi:MAG: acyltransferase [Hymenobacter sp.]|nr:MAG: acyltransferase [Hymenobacter sp.]
MKSLIERFVHRRNPHFTLHPAVSTSVLLSFGAETARNLVRGSRLWLRGRASGGAMLGRGVRFQHLGLIRFGKWLKAGDHAHFSGLGTGGLTMGDSVSIGAFSRVIVSTSLAEPGCYIKLGHRVGIGEFAYLGGGGGLSIGDDCIIGQYFSCHPENHLHGDYKELIRLQGVVRQGISIGPNCWIGSKVTVLDGVTIGAGCVVAAGAVVTRSVPAGSVVAGVPARILSSRLAPAPAESLSEILTAA